MSSLSLRIGRFAGVGVVATLVHVSAAFLANQSGAAGPMAANSIGFACAVAVTYLGHFYWTFPGAGGHVRSLHRFAVAAGLTYLWTSSIVYIVSDRLGWPFIAALAVILVTAPPANFVLSQAWVFRRDRADAEWFDFEVPSLVALLLAAAWYYSGTVLNHDTSWYLIATPRWLDGAELYRDIVEINPPLAFYLTAPAILLSRATGLAPHQAFVLQLLALSLASLVWFRDLLRRSPAISGPHRTILLAAAFAALCITPVGNFGQREHLMVIFALPYIGLMAFSPASGRLERGLIGAFALLGLALKPYFLALPLFMALLMLARERRLPAPFTPEHLVIGVGCILYVLAIWLVHPLYITDIVPLGRLVYESYGGSTMHVLLVSGFAALPLLLALTLGLPKGSDREVAVRLLVVTVAFVVAYLVQFKGWEYQRIPIYSALCLWWAWMAAALYQRFHGARLGDVLVRSVLLAVAILPLAVPVISGPYQPRYTAAFPAHLRDASSFMAFTAHVVFTYPLANVTGATPTSRYSALWLIPGAVSRLASGDETTTQEREALQQALETARRTTADDFLDGRPDVVFVDVRQEKPYFGDVDFDYLAFFHRDPRFRAAWRDYRHIDTEAGFEVWRRNAHGR